jgi:signal transduction histidine kinase
VEEHVKAWGAVAAETERTTDLLADLLTLARSDAGQAGLEFSPMDLSEAVRAAAEEMRVMADAKELQLFVDASTPCPMCGDADALRRAICILIDNAIKFTAGGGEIQIKVEADEAASVSVSDNGAGIGPADLPLIFERFYRVSKDRSRKTGGAGLGLSIAQWIVKRHGGEIKAESAVGKGSVFTIVLPLH